MKKQNNKRTVVLGTKNGYNVILCKKDPSFERSDLGQWSFFCEYCGRTHFHGHGEGHRVSHCLLNNKSLFKNDYIITINPNFKCDEKKASNHIIERDKKFYENIKKKVDLLTPLKTLKKK